MKKFFLSILTVLVLGGHFLSATSSFSAVVAGNTGIEFDNFDNAEKDFKIPISAFAAVQFDFAEKFTLRGEMDFFSDGNSISAFDGNEFLKAEGGNTSLSLHELSFIYTKRAIKSTHFFSAFLGYHEPIGTDTFLMRQFGCDPISSSLTKSFSNISGIPLYYNSGLGISYFSRLEKAPLSLGGSLCFFKNDIEGFDASGARTLNIDFRLATSFPVITADLGFGFGFPLENDFDFIDKEEEYSISIRVKDVFYNFGINMLLGNKYGHGLLLQFGMKNFSLGKKSTSPNSRVTFMLEPRLRFRTFKLNFAVYSFEEKNVKKTLYLVDPLGVGLTVEFDSIPAKIAHISAGFHLVASVDKEIRDDFSFDFDISDLNFYVSPFVDIPLSSSMSINVMGQIGLQNLLGGDRFDLKIKAMVGFKKQF